MPGSFILVMAPPGLEPSTSAFAASNAQKFEGLADAIFAGQAQSDIRQAPWISFENLIFTPDHIWVIFNKILTDASKGLRDPDELDQ